MRINLNEFGSVASNGHYSNPEDQTMAGHNRCWTMDPAIISSQNREPEARHCGFFASIESESQ